MKLLTAFVALNALDIALTLLVVGNGGTELNPIMAYALGLGIPTAIIIKTIGALAIALLILRLGRTTVLRACTVGMAAVCTFNLYGMV